MDEPPILRYRPQYQLQSGQLDLDPPVQGPGSRDDSKGHAKFLRATKIVGMKLGFVWCVCS